MVKKIKPDFKKLGPRYGKIMKALAAAIQAMSQDEINAFEKAGTFTLTVEGQEAMIERADVEIISEDIPGWLVANEGRLTVALDITVTENLRKEGLARELVNPYPESCVRAAVTTLLTKYPSLSFRTMGWTRRSRTSIPISQTRCWLYQWKLRM